MDSNNFLYPSDGGFIYDQNLEVSEHQLDSHHPLASLAEYTPTQDVPIRKPPRPQRQKSLTSEPPKHRRTRSGCFTCRQRRVKCDEARPVCERCRKGKRDCTYPEKSKSSKGGRSTAKSKSSSVDNTSLSSEDDDQDTTVVSLTPEEVEVTSVASSRPSRADSKRSNTALFESEDAQQASARPTPGLVLEQLSTWKQYPPDVKFYLQHFRSSITYCHYAFKHDCRDFLKTAYLESAIKFEPLFYALLAFSAYHYSLRFTDSKPEKFLDYYNQSVSLFRQVLAKGASNPVPVLLTMLQLATIEEFLGDWVNLLGHQRAAAQYIKERYTPDAMTQTFTHRVILVWYWRFDLFAGVLSGNQLTLGREWFVSVAESCSAAAARNTSGELGFYFDDFFTNSRLLVTDVTLLFAAQAAGTIDEDDFAREATQLWTRMEAHAARVESAFRDTLHFNKTWSTVPDEDCLTDYKDPNFQHNGVYFTMNYILVDSWSGRVMFAHRLGSLRQKGIYTRAEPALAPDLVHDLVLRICKMAESIQYSDTAPAGAVLGLQASIGLVSLFIPHEERFTDWTRRKLALIETNGYIYPPSYRKYLAQLWQLDVNYWWLPNGERLTPMIKSMRKFIDFRGENTHSLLDNQVTDVRDMRGIFARLNLAISPLRQLDTED